jgi:cyclase
MTTSRRLFLSGASAAALGLIVLPRALRAQERPGDAARAAGVPAALETITLDDDLKVVTGAGGNIAVHHTPLATLVVDAGIPQRAADVAAAVAGLAGRSGSRMLVNTHWHFDHIGANETLASIAAYTIIAHDNCRARLSEKRTIEDLGMTFEPLPPIARPMVTFAESMTLHAPDRIVLTKIPTAHTDTDITVEFVEHDVLHTGDLFFNGMFPVIDRSTGGSLDGMIASTKLLLSRVSDKTRIIPGHGPMARKPDLQAQLGLLELVRTKLEPLGQAKTSMDEVLAKAPLADLDDKWGRGFLRSPVFTRMAYGQWLTK